MDDKTIRYIVQIAAIIALMALLPPAILNYVQEIEFENEIIKFIIIIIVIVVEAVESHIVINAIRNRKEVGRRAKETHACLIHSCNADPKHCFTFKGEPLPICARHLGFYAALFILIIIGLLFYKQITIFAITLQPEVHLSLTFLFMAIVAAEGTLGKMRKIKVPNYVRCIGGVMTILSVFFFIMFFISLANTILNNF